MALTERQKKLLDLLLDKYERSKSYAGTNMLRQRFSVTPDKIWKPYGDNFADVAEIADFEREIRELQNKGLISVEESGGEIRKIYAVTERFDAYYSLLGRLEKNERIRQEYDLYRAYLEEHPILKRFAQAQIDRLDSGKKAEYPVERAGQICRLLKVILDEHDEMLERELSIEVLSDTKLFERSFRNSVCRILEMYGERQVLFSWEMSQRERQQILLAEYGVMSNPTYVYVKGAAEFRFQDGEVWHLKPWSPMALSAQMISQIAQMRIENRQVMTIENMTTFHRCEPEDTFCMYIGGYHNMAIQGLVNRIAADNSDLRWLHFGDIDPDGFYILENLKNKTGLEIEPYRMGVDTIQRFRKYAKPLEKQDVRKAKVLLEKGLYTSVLSFVLKENIKLEQEIVGWRGNVM